MSMLAGLTACATVPPSATPAASPPAAPHPAVPASADAPPAGARYLYGSGEAAALTEQAFNALVAHARLWVASEKQRPGPRVSAILDAQATPDQPVALPCRAGQPRAVVFDMDETLVANLGYEYDDIRHGRTFDDARWGRFEKTGAASVVALPGAVDALFLLRGLGLTMVVNSNRDASAAAETERTLADVGLGAFRHGDTLFLKGDLDAKSAKDGRRAAIAARYCVIAQVGDQLSDFSDVFSGPAPARRIAVQAAATRGLFGTFWFVMPNPVYGTGIAGSWDEVFPGDKRWTDPASPDDRH